MYLCTCIPVYLYNCIRPFQSPKSGHYRFARAWIPALYVLESRRAREPPKRPLPGAVPVAAAASESRFWPILACNPKTKSLHQAAMVDCSLFLCVVRTQSAFIWYALGTVHLCLHLPTALPSVHYYTTIQTKLSIGSAVHQSCIHCITSRSSNSAAPLSRATKCLLCLLPP